MQPSARPLAIASRPKMDEYFQLSITEKTQNSTMEKIAQTLQITYKQSLESEVMRGIAKWKD